MWSSGCLSEKNELQLTCSNEGRNAMNSENMNMKTWRIVTIALVFILILYGCEGNAENFNMDIYQNVFEVSELLDDNTYHEYMNDDGTQFRTVIEYKKQMDNASEFEFFAYSNNFIEMINSDIPDVCVVNHGTDFEADSQYEIDGDRITATEAIQVSENFFDLFPMETDEGRGFILSDFDIDGNGCIPVILGDTYRDTFRLGEVFEGYYICERKAFQVVGFAKPGFRFYSRSKSQTEEFDRYIVMPFPHIPEDTFSGRAILLQQIGGFIRSENNHSAILQSVRQYLANAGLEKWVHMIVVNEKSIREKMNGVF